ncbi:pilus assembly protein PilP [Melaminivora sp.]|uniref:pilus assembly protein PilP n=1 Tax=Melaminivora sp. TaxID=1933032 RepID=UPI0028A7C48E|nr:pilus assembly protein PilP [Melaminivora sp.]
MTLERPRAARWPALLAACLAAALAGCGASGDEDLRQWMVGLRASTQPRALPVAEPVPFAPQDYLGAAGADPFAAQRLTQALHRDSPASARALLIAPELARPREPLEAYPLDALKMVGSLKKEGVPTALIAVDRLLYQVRVGDHMGQNYGKIIAISDAAVQLRELIQDVGGDWLEKVTTLQLQDAAGEKP